MSQRSDSVSDPLAVVGNKKCKTVPKVTSTPAREPEPVFPAITTPADRDTRDLQTWFISLVNEGLPLPSFLKVGEIT